MKIRSILPCLLVLCLLAGCGKSAPAPAEEAELSTQTYTLSYVSSGILGYNATDFQLTGALELCSDGTATLRYDNQVTVFSYDESNLWLPDTPQELYPYSLENNRLILELPAETLIFQKQ